MSPADNDDLEGPDRPIRHKNDELLIGKDNPFFTFQFKIEVITEKAAPLLLTVFLLYPQLLRRFIGDTCAGPDLTMRMGIAGSHHGAAVLEYLNVIDPIEFAEFGILLCPGVNDSSYLYGVHSRQREIMTRRKAHYPADARLSPSNNQTAVVFFY